MDKRAARRLVTQRVAAAVRALTDDELFSGYAPDDRRRLRAARDELAFELEVRAGITPRVPRFDPPDPAQYALIHLEEDHATDHSRSPTG